MNDYTPTTGHILEAFAWDERYDGLDIEKMKQFDRWLAEVKAKAWEEGQISLLKYMGFPLYPSKGDEPRNPKQPLNPYRQGYKDILQSPPLFPEHVGETE